jgi:hypothetical protein
MQKAFPGLPTMETTVKELKRSHQSHQSHQYKPYTVYLNRLSDAVHKKLGRSTNATVIINKPTSPIRQTLREALGGSYPFLRPPQ